VIRKALFLLLAVLAVSAALADVVSHVHPWTFWHVGDENDPAYGVRVSAGWILIWHFQPVLDPRMSQVHRPEAGPPSEPPSPPAPIRSKWDVTVVGRSSTLSPLEGDTSVEIGSASRPRTLVYSPSSKQNALRTTVSYCWLDVAAPVLAAYPLIALFFGLLRRRRRKRRGLCPACGYDLAGSTHGTCPECGTEGKPSRV